jgi:hypothetical protein
MIDPVALLKNYHAALNAFDLDKVEALFESDASYTSHGFNGKVLGSEAIMQAMRIYFAEYDDQVSTDTEVKILSAHSALAKWQLKATSNITHAKINRQGTEIIQFSINGLIASVEVMDE